MHYIRFLKPPRVVPSAPTISSKVTVTTDLGESFLTLDVVLIADIQDQTGSSIYGNSKKSFLWKGSNGMRAIEVLLPKPRQVRHDQVLQMVVKPKDEKYAVDDFLEIMEDAMEENEDDGEERGRIVAVRSLPIDFIGTSRGPMEMAERVFTSYRPNDENRSVHIWEETGESIARHVWDAGLVLSSYLATLCGKDAHRSQQGNGTIKLPKLERLLLSENLNVLELGAGCGIVGLTLARLHHSIRTIKLTDLPEASSILQKNIFEHTKASGQSLTAIEAIQHQVLDWSIEQLPSDILDHSWDMVLVADCTYNPDVVPDLVKTLKRITTQQKEDVLICLAMKVRHDSELIFFDLMEAAGYQILEKGKLRLPVLGDESQQIEVFIFGGKACTASG